MLITIRWERETLCYSVIYPIILPAGLLLFIMKHALNKYLMLCNKFKHKSLLCVFTSCYFIYQLFTGLIFVINKDFTIKHIGSGYVLTIIFILLLFRIDLFLKIMNQKIIKVMQIEAKESENLNNMNMIYMHPVEKKSKEADSPVSSMSPTSPSFTEGSVLEIEK